MNHFLTRVLAAFAVALLPLFAAAGAATAAAPPPGPGADKQPPDQIAGIPPRDNSTILVKWAFRIPTPQTPLGDQTVGELKTRVKIVKVKRGFTIDQMLSLYRSLPGVVYAEPNYLARGHLAAPNDYFFPAQWALAKIQALDGWGIYPGAYGVNTGAPIAIVDTGVDPSHPDFGGRVTNGASCLTGVCVTAPGFDDNGHGTVNAGAAAAAANNGQGLAGLSYGASIVPVKVLDATGSGTYAAIAAGIIWAADNGARAINLSLGGIASSQALCESVSYALGKGALVVAASGNLGISDPVYPAACPGAVGVGATNPDDGTPPWSDSGAPTVFVSAPGVAIHTTYLNGGYALATGTSISTAFVSGLASLLYGQNPTRTPAEIRRILATTSDKVGTQPYGADPYGTCAGCTWSSTTGYGRINVQRALSAGGTTAQVPPAPQPAAPVQDFTISASPVSITTVQGGRVTYTVSIGAQDVFNGTAALSVSGLPTGATASFAPASVPASGSSALTVTTWSGTPVGSYPLTIRGTSGALSHATSVTLRVNAAPLPAVPVAGNSAGNADFGIVLAPGSRIVKRSKPAFFTVNVTAAAGVAPGGVQLSVSGLPVGVTATFSPTSVLTPGSSTLRVEASPLATRFVTSTLTITGTYGSATRTATATITVL